MFWIARSAPVVPHIRRHCGGELGLGDLEECGQGFGLDMEIGADHPIVDAGLAQA